MLLFKAHHHHQAAGHAKVARRGSFNYSRIHRRYAVRSLAGWLLGWMLCDACAEHHHLIPLHKAAVADARSVLVPNLVPTPAHAHINSFCTFAHRRARGGVQHQMNNDTHRPLVSTPNFASFQTLFGLCGLSTLRHTDLTTKSVHLTRFCIIRIIYFSYWPTFAFCLQP